MQSLGRKENTQTPGLTTELPHHWSVDLEMAQGGEDSPMQTSEIKGGLFKPMRIMQQSEIVDVLDGETTIPAPKETGRGLFSHP